MIERLELTKQRFLELEEELISAGRDTQIGSIDDIYGVFEAVVKWILD